MPEGDSVYLVARTLRRRLGGRTITRSDFRTPKLATRDLSGRVLTEVDTHGKHLLQRFEASDGGQVTLHSHLRLDGEWSVTAAGKQLPSRMHHMVRVVLATADAVAWGLRMHDLELVPTAEEHRVVGHLGPDPLRADWNHDEAVRRLCADPSLPVVSALLDQRSIAGLGNLWVNELAFLTGVSPWTPIGELDVDRLVRRAATMLHHSATVPGAYQTTTGLAGRGKDHWITGRQRTGCLRCKGPVTLVEEIANDPANRRTWWCRHCQPGPGPEARLPSRRPG